MFTALPQKLLLPPQKLSLQKRAVAHESTPLVERLLLDFLCLLLHTSHPRYLVLQSLLIVFLLVQQPCIFPLVTGQPVQVTPKRPLSPQVCLNLLETEPRELSLEEEPPLIASACLQDLGSQKLPFPLLCPQTQNMTPSLPPLETTALLRILLPTRYRRDPS